MYMLSVYVCSVVNVALLIVIIIVQIARIDGKWDNGGKWHSSAVNSMLLDAGAMQHQHLMHAQAINVDAH